MLSVKLSPTHWGIVNLFNFILGKGSVEAARVSEGHMRAQAASTKGVTRRRIISSVCFILGS